MGCETSRISSTWKTYLPWRKPQKSRCRTSSGTRGSAAWDRSDPSSSCSTNSALRSSGRVPKAATELPREATMTASHSSRTEMPSVLWTCKLSASSPRLIAGSESQQRLSQPTNGSGNMPPGQPEALPSSSGGDTLDRQGKAPCRAKKHADRRVRWVNSSRVRASQSDTQRRQGLWMMACAHSCLLPPFPFSSTLAVATSRVRAIKSLFGRVYVTATSALASSEGGARARAVASMSARAPGATTPDGARKPVGLLVLSGPGAPELKYLERLPPSVRIVAVGQRLEEFSHLSAEGWASVECMLNCGVLENAAKRETIEGVWPRVPNLHWFHLASAGIEHVVFPALVASDVVLTNAKGCFSHSLAEYALFGCKYFALDYPRMAAAKRQSQWAPYDVEELREKRMGIVGYGDIGQAVARIARAFRMKVVGLRRRKELSAEEEKEGLVEKMYGTDQLIEMVGECDYVVMATPFTPATHKMFSREAVAAMKPNAVFVNIGRGKCVDEDALVEALEARKIRGAVLDVTYTEPLPKDHKLWTLPNVVLSPHCSADRTDQFQFDAMDLFVRNAHRYVAGESVLNVVDKAAGY